MMLAGVGNADRVFRDAQERRRQQIVDAVRAGIPLREVASAAGCSHESVRRIVAADGALALEFRGAAYPLTKDQIELLIYKLAGYAAGRFPRDVELLGAGDGWLEAAGGLADVLQAALVDELSEVVRLDPGTAFALHQVLRLTHLTVPSVMSQLAEALAASAT